MSSGFRIAEVRVGPGWLGIAPVPGRTARLSHDLDLIAHWGAAMVLTMLPAGERVELDVVGMAEGLIARGIDWHEMPVEDFSIPEIGSEELWIEVAAFAHAHLEAGRKVLIHCRGGCGRSGMAALRLMIEAGENADDALRRLRQVRPCAVETPAQMQWARSPGH